MSHIAQNFDSIWAFRPDPSDLLIATYPKAGTDSSTHIWCWQTRCTPLHHYLHFPVICVNEHAEIIKNANIICQTFINMAFI